MSQLGPIRQVTEKVRAGRRGTTKWLVGLECGHAYTLDRKLYGDAVRCDQCVPPEVPEEEVILDLSEEFTRVKVASLFGVDGEQVTMFDGGCSVHLTTIQIRKLLIEGT